MEHVIEYAKDLGGIGAVVFALLWYHAKFVELPREKAQQLQVFLEMMKSLKSELDKQ